MSISITLYNTSSDPRKISKSLTTIGTFTGTIKDITNVVNPAVTLTFDSIISGPPELPAFNYAYIPSFDRYYFVKDSKCIRATLWEISLDVDVLMSFNISGVSGVVTETQSVNADPYLENRSFVTKVKDKTDIKVFPGGLLDSGEFILITAGG